MPQLSLVVYLAVMSVSLGFGCGFWVVMVWSCRAGHRDPVSGFDWCFVEGFKSEWKALVLWGTIRIIFARSRLS